MKITTKTGDGGLSDIKNARLPKNHMVFEAMGSIDELMALISIEEINLNDYKEILQEINQHLFTINAYLARYVDDPKSASMIKILETKSTAMLEELGNFQFVNSFKHSASAKINYIRAKTRSVERILVDFFSKESYDNHPNVLMFFNRLSDYFFALTVYLEK